jgi:hypothetical protein
MNGSNIMKYKLISKRTEIGCKWGSKEKRWREENRDQEGKYKERKNKRSKEKVIHRIE